MRQENSSFTFSGGSIFWLYIIIATYSGLIWLSLWSFQNEFLQPAIMSFIFMFMIIFGIVLSKFEILNSGSITQNSFFFVLGFILWYLFSFIVKNVSAGQFSMTSNNLFSSVQGILPLTLETTLNNYIIPVSEELFFMVAIPISLFTIFNQLGKKYKIFSNEWFQLLLVILISGISFAIFHVGKLNIPFLIAAFLFRGLMVFFVYGDKKKDIIKNADLVVAFAVGAHIANNVFQTGFGLSMQVLLQNFTTFGWIIIGFFIVTFLFALDYIIRIFSNKKIPVVD